MDLTKLFENKNENEKVFIFQITFLHYGVMGIKRRRILRRFQKYNFSFPKTHLNNWIPDLKMA
jgi:hypothetical protein